MECVESHARPALMDIPPEMGSPPRPESVGEQEQRWADNINAISSRFGLKLSNQERMAIARFAVRIALDLTPEEQEKATETVTTMLQWLLKQGKSS